MLLNRSAYIRDSVICQSGHTDAQLHFPLSIIHAQVEQVHRSETHSQTSLCPKERLRLRPHKDQFRRTRKIFTDTPLLSMKPAFHLSGNYHFQKRVWEWRNLKTAFTRLTLESYLHLTHPDTHERKSENKTTASLQHLLHIKSVTHAHVCLHCTDFCTCPVYALSFIAPPQAWNVLYSVLISFQ